MTANSSIEERRQAVRNLKSRLVDLSLVVMAVIAVPGAISSLSRIKEMGFITPMYFHIVLAAYLVLIGFYRKKLSYQFRANSILVVLFLIGFAGLWNLGLSGNGSMFLLVSIIFASVMFSKKAGIKMFILASLLIISKAATLHFTDATFEIDFKLYNYAITSWVALYFGFCFVSVLMLAVLGQFNKFFYTMVEELEVLISQRTQELEQANQAKSQFLSNISHEIRTPLNGIIGIHNLLACSSLNETQRRQLDIADKSAQSLLHVVNDVLDFSSVESGNMQLHPMQFELIEMLQSLVDKMRTQLKTNLVKLELVLDDNQPLHVYADRHRLSQILLNLISNAIKFTNQGEIIVSAKTSAIQNEDGSDGWILNCSVIDTGIGIAEPMKDKLFESFYQSDASTTRKFGGSGLGLTLVKNLCEAMHGKIEVSSVLGQGSEFSFEVFLKKGKPNAGTESESKAKHNIEQVDFDNEIESHFGIVNAKSNQMLKKHQPEQNNLSIKSEDLTQSKLLIVEDNPINQEVLLGIIEEFGYSADIAINGIDAIDKLKLKSTQDDHYDIILMDCQMPEMDGYQATQQIRKGNTGQINQSIIIIAVTANAMEGDKQKCLNAGMNDYLAKPINPKHLHAKLTFWLNPKQTNEQASTTDKSKSGDKMLKVETYQEQALPIWDKEDVLKRVMFKENLLQALLGSFLNEMPKRMQNLSDAINQQDCQQVAGHAHAIKGVSANLGGKRLHQCSLELEDFAKKNALAEMLTKRDEINNEYEALSDFFKAELSIEDNLSEQTDNEYFSKIKYTLMQLETKLVNHDYIDPDEISALINITKSQSINQKLLQMKQQVTQFDTESVQASIDAIVEQLDSEVK